MRLVIQRVSKASVSINEEVYSHISEGLLVLAGIEEADSKEDAEWLSSKLVNMRIFSDPEGKMNLCVKDTNGDILIVSQFTLHSSTKKGNRPSFLQAARPEKAIPLYEFFIDKVQSDLGKTVKTGVFGADMKVELINAGPVTILIDSKQRE
jgi:D-aminoacyl-tRNA deacylase